MEQLLVHCLGDYVLQSDWMALNKSKRSFHCLVHVILYTSVFLLITQSVPALMLIGITHFILDRFPQILRRLIWTKNHLGPGFKYVPYRVCNLTGYFDNSRPDETQIIRYQERPKFITVWLYIITDNFCHLALNYLILKYLG